MLQQILQLLQQLVTWKNDVIANAKTTEELDALDPILRNALFRAFVSGQSKKISIQELIDEIASELALGNVPVVFKPVVIDFNTPGTTQSKIRAKLNSDPNYILKQGTLYIPYVQRIVLSNGTGFGLLPGSTGNYAIVTEYFMLTQGIEPDGDGIASIGIDGTEILSNGIRYFNTVDSRNFAPVDFYLGDIATDEIWDVVNLLGPGTDPVGPLSTPNGTTVLFFATQDGEERIWLYRGAQEQVGLGEPATTEDDFRLFPSEDETDPPPAYQETVPQIGFSGSSILYVDNHEGRLISMDAPFYQTSFTTRRLRLGGFTRALINTTGQTEYPKVKNKWLLKMGTGSGTANIVISGTNYLISQNATPYVMENNFVATHAANILSSKGLTVIFNSDGYLEFDGLTVPSITIVTASGTLTGTVRTIAAVQINTPEFTVGLFDMFTEFDGKQINYTFKPRVIEGYNGFVLKQYDDIDDLLSNQSEQKPSALYLVIDASDDTNISFGVGETKLQATYRFKGTSEIGSISDYTLISAPYGNHINTKPLVTADTGNEITLYPSGNFCNSISPNLSKSFTHLLTNSLSSAGETATVLIKTEVGDVTFPSVSMSDYVEGAAFEENLYYDLVIWNNGNKTTHTFLLRPAVIEPLGLKTNVFDTATQTSLNTIWWFTPYLASDFPELTFTKTYFFLYSSDHDAGDGGIYVGEGDELDLSDFVELGLVIDGYQTETPYLYRFPSNTRKIHLYFHTAASDPANGGIQRTRLVSTNSGSLHDSTWTTETNPLGSEAGDQHLGYFTFWDNGTILKGVHFKRGAGLVGYLDGTDQYSVLASDGLSSTRGAIVDRYFNLFGSSRYPQLSVGKFFKKYDQWWWIGNTRYTAAGFPDNPTPTDGGVRMVLCKANEDFEITEFITELAGNGKYWFFYIDGTSLAPGDTLHCYECINVLPSHMNYTTFDLTQLEVLP
jgi:hypothetical protein